MPRKGQTPYKTDMALKIVELMNDGWSIAEVGRELKCGKTALYELAKTHEDISDALELGSDLSEGWWTEVGRNSLYDKDLNDRLWYRNMANRFGWRDNKNVEVKGTISVEDQLKALA